MISRKTIERFAFIAAFASVLLFSGVVDAVAQVQNLSRQVEGAGPSRNAAIQNALIEATRQLYGVSIQSVTSSESHSVVGMSETDGAAIDQTFYVDSLNRSIREQIGGPGKRPYISGYELLDVEEDDAGQFVATIEVGYTKYKVPGPANNRRRLAFYGVTVDSDTVQNFVLADKAAVQIGDRFEEVMVQSRRFAMLERSGHDVVGTEKVYLKYHGASNAELARFGQTMGADYIVYGIVTSASFSQNAKTIEVTGQTIHSGTAKLEIAYKVVAVATHQIKWSTRLKETTSWRGQKGVGGVRTQLAEKLAQKMADNLLENIFPPKLIKVEGEQLYINRGGDTVSVGDLFSAYMEGEKLIDPDTNESLGKTESKIGEIQITSIWPKYSVGKVVAGAIAAGDAKKVVLRRKSGAGHAYSGDRKRSDAGQGRKGAAKQQPAKFQDENSNNIPDYLE